MQCAAVCRVQILNGGIKMKKTFRILLALTLSALLLLPATAFALANGDAVEWTFSEEEITRDRKNVV